MSFFFFFSLRWVWCRFNLSWLWIFLDFYEFNRFGSGFFFFWLMLVQYVLDVDFSWLLWIVNILVFSLCRFGLGCPVWVLDVVVFDLDMLNLGLSITHPNWPNQLNLCNVSIDSQSLVMETNKISSVFGLAGWETEEPTRPMIPASSAPVSSPPSMMTLTFSNACVTCNQTRISGVISADSIRTLPDLRRSQPIQWDLL